MGVEKEGSKFDSREHHILNEWRLTGPSNVDTNGAPLYLKYDEPPAYVVSKSEIASSGQDPLPAKSNEKQRVKPKEPAAEKAF